MSFNNNKNLILNNVNQGLGSLTSPTAFIIVIGTSWVHTVLNLPLWFTTITFKERSPGKVTIKQ